ncbi:MAG: hypothetical protein QUS09_04120 [Methanotrichaceae archaeon]|nr:hypothetical protein [Methanotrichaceae archaeon]
MSKRIRTCLVLLIMIMLFSPLSAALPSAFEEDHSGDDLDELESMLSGEHRGSSYSRSYDQGRTDIYRSSQTPQTFTGPAYDPPYKDAFKNDTYFGDFIRQLDGALAQEINETWNELYLNGTLYLNVTEKKAEKPSRHFIKPILIEEPDF